MNYLAAAEFNTGRSLYAEIISAAAAQAPPQRRQVTARVARAHSHVTSLHKLTLTARCAAGG